MADIQIREVREGDAEALLTNLRPADIAECNALHGPNSAREAVDESIHKSAAVWACTVDGQVMCIFGVVPVNYLAGLGMPWLIGTPLIDTHRSAFIRRSPTYIAHMLVVFPSLANVVDARNLKSIAWLKRLGFKIHAPVPCGFAGLPFHPFTMEA